MNGHMAQRVMLLVDADNVSADVIAQAFQHVFSRYGAVHVRRAYCTAESALKHMALFTSLSIRPIVNLSTGKNSTDIALAVDAVDLVVAERPQVVVIVSSDSDFAPLVIRLREKGCRVEGIGQKGKTGDDTTMVYDDFVDMTHRKPPARPPAKRAAARSAPRAVPIAAAPEAPAPLPPSPLPDEVRQILAAIPELQQGGKFELGLAAERLRNADLLAPKAASPRLFKKHPEFFMLTPERQPNKVQYLGPQRG